MRSLGLFLLRLVFGSMIALHGFPKLFGGPGRRVSPQAERVLGGGFRSAMEHGGLANMTAMAERMGVPAPPQLAAASAAAQFFGGLALILGWRTRLASLLLIADTAVTLRTRHWEQGIMGAEDGAEESLLSLGALLTLFVAGPGKLSLDRG